MTAIRFISDRLIFGNTFCGGVAFVGRISGTKKPSKFSDKKMYKIFRNRITNELYGLQCITTQPETGND